MKTSLTIFVLFVFSVVNFQSNGQNIASTSFKDATIFLDQKTDSPKHIRLKEGNYISINSFFNEYRDAFNLSSDNEFRSFRTLTDKLGQRHHRYKQYYKGIEIADVHYILHEYDGMVIHANGDLIHGLDIDVTPALSEEAALERALTNFNAESYMWENHKNEAYIKREQNDPDATMYPKGVLMLSAKNVDLRKDNIHLVYRFDIYSEKPLERYYVDVDAKTGEIINKISRIKTGDVPGQGTSVYNGVVSITVADTTISSRGSGSWHINSWNAHQGELSWWDGDPRYGDQGGYANGWYDVLDTDPIVLSGSNLTLEFYHRYKVEEPAGATPPYNGWDGMNVRISTDNGDSWEVLQNPVPAYSNSSLWSFGDSEEGHGEGPGIPGWTGELLNWTNVTVDLTAYAGRTVKIRFAFASDLGLSTLDGQPDLFGWQIDSIRVTNSSGTLYNNNGEMNGVTSVNLAKVRATLIPGNYRLRQYGRNDMIATFDAQNGTSLPLSVDFVDTDSSFDSDNAKAGVSVHWGLENTYDYFLNNHGRDSYDDNGGKMIAYAHFWDGVLNASWDGSVMRFGDGPSNNAPVVSIDVVSHELTHGVTEYTANLVYQREYGALSESFSDIFGTAVEFYALGSAGNWFIGEGAIRLRSMSNPNQYGDPDTYFGDFWAPLDGGDNGGVHTNSGVQNFWFYLLSEGGSGVNDNGDPYSVTGLGIEDAAKIAYRNLAFYLTPTSEYEDARLGALQAARDLFGDSSQQFQSTADAWHAVGVYVPFIEPTVNITPEAPIFSAELSTVPDTVSLTIANYGISSLTITDLQVSGTHFEITSAPYLPIELTDLLDEFTISIAFTPTEEGTVNETLTIVSNGPNSPNLIPLKGTGFEINEAFTTVLYSSTGTQEDGKMLTINRASGSGSELGLSNFDDLISISVDPITNILYGIRSNVSETEFVKINGTGGDAWSLYNFSLGNMVGIGFTSMGDLYSALRNGEIYTIDLTDGRYNLVVTADRQLESMEIDPNTDVMYAAPRIVIGAGRDRIYTVNMTTGETTLIGQTGFGVTTNDMAFDENGVMFGVIGVENEEGELITISTTDGSGTMVGGIGFQNVLGLGYAINGIVNSVTPDGDENVVPKEYSLSQNYPNPFNPSTLIEFSLPVNSDVRLTIYNLLGQAVTELINEEISSGSYSVVWNGEDQNGLKVSSGIYLYKIQANGANGKEFQQIRKMVLLK
jgi:Zn-dependent metalloprotease